MKKNPCVGIILLNYRQNELTYKCLNALKEQVFLDFSVIVMENSPKEEALKEDTLQRDFSSFPIRVIRNENNCGFGAGNNPGIRKFLLEGVSYIWILNNDTIVDAKALSQTISKMETLPNCGMMGMKIMNPNQGNNPGGLQFFGGCLYNMLKFYPVPNTDSKRMPDYISMCSAVIRAEAIRDAGLFDETFFMYGEDTDLSFRILKAGWKLNVCQNAIVYHYGGASDSGNLFYAYNFLSSIQLAQKYATNPLISKFWIVETRLIAPFFKGRWKEFFGVCFGLRKAKKKIAEINSKRSQKCIVQTRQTNDSETSPQKSVVIFGTIYALLTYLLYSPEDKIRNTVFFFEDGVIKPFFNCIPVKSFQMRKQNFLYKLLALFWVLKIRFLRMTVWRKYFHDAELFAQDHFTYSPPLIGNSPYTLISDGFNDFCELTKTELFQNTKKFQKKTWKNAILRMINGAIWMKMFGQDTLCTGLLHENPKPLPYRTDTIRLLGVDFEKEWETASKKKKKMILNIYGVNDFLIEAFSKCSILLLAQNFECFGLTEQEMVETYRNAIAPYAESQVLIKAHPFGKIDYSQYFPQAVFFKEKIPMQLLALLGYKNFTTVITICSSAISLFDNHVKIIWLGEKAHPKLEKLFGHMDRNAIVYSAHSKETSHKQINSTNYITQERK